MTVKRIALLGAILTLVACGDPNAKYNHASTMKLESPAFAEGQPIATVYTCYGKNISPPLSVSKLPDRTESLALIAYDQDAPSGSFVHWSMWNIDPRNTSIPEGNVPENAVIGVNDEGTLGYFGPCPPSETHHYVFTVYALSTPMPIPPTSTAVELRSAMGGAILGEARLTGVYTRE